MKKTKKLLIFGLPLISSVLMPLVISTSCKNNKSKEKYIFGNQTFNSAEDLRKYLNSAVRLEQVNEFKYVFAIGNKTFENYNLLQSFLYSKIKRIDVSIAKTNREIENLLTANQEIDSSLLGLMNFNNEDENINVYQGKNQIAYQNIIDAKNSYFNINKVYKFGNQYYSSKENLANLYLKEANEIINDSTYPKNENKADRLNNKFGNQPIENNKVISFINGSNYEVEMDSDGKPKNLGELKRLLKFNVNKYYSVRDRNGKIKLYTKEQLLANKNLLLSDLTKFDVLKLSSNKGIKKFLVDIDKEDKYTLYGNYIHESTNNSILDFDDPSKWTSSKEIINKNLERPTAYFNNINNFASFIFQSINASKSEEFLNNLKNNSLTANEQNIHNILKEQAINNRQSINDIVNSYTNDFNLFKIFELIPEFEKFKLNMETVIINQMTQENLFNKMKQIIDFMQKGKRGNLLNQIAVLYSTGISYLINYDASRAVVNNFKNYFKLVINHFDQTLKNIVGPELYIDNQGQELNLFDKFRMNGFDYDINSNINAFGNYLANSRWVNYAITTIMQAHKSLTMNSGVLDFDKSFIKKDDLSFTGKIIHLENLYQKFNAKAIVKPLLKFDETTCRFEASKDSDNIYRYHLAKTIANSANNLNKQFERIWDGKYFSQVTLNMTITQKQTFYSKVRSEMLTICEQNKNNNHYYEEVHTLLKQNTLFTKETVIQINNLTSKTYTKHGKTKKLFSPFAYAKSKYRKINEKLKNNKTLDKVDKAFQYAEAGLTLISGLSNLLGSIGQDQGDFTHENNFIAAEQIINGILGFLPNDPLGILIKTGVKLILNIVGEIIGHNEIRDYVFTDSENSANPYIWNGGLDVHRFWGLWTENKRTIKNAKLLKPIEFTLDSTYDVYLYNGKNIMQAILSKWKKTF